MPGPDQLIRAAVTLPFGIARRVFGIAAGLLPGGAPDPDERVPPPVTDVDVEVAVATDDAMTRVREPVEEGALAPDDPLAGHVEDEREVVAESADIEAAEPPGAEVRVEDRR